MTLINIDPDRVIAFGQGHELVHLRGTQWAVGWHSEARTYGRAIKCRCISDAGRENVTEGEDRWLCADTVVQVL